MTGLKEHHPTEKELGLFDAPIGLLGSLFHEIHHVKYDGFNTLGYVKENMTNAATKLGIFRDGMFDYLNPASSLDGPVPD